MLLLRVADVITFCWARVWGIIWAERQASTPGRGMKREPAVQHAAGAVAAAPIGQRSAFRLGGTRRIGRSGAQRDGSRGRWPCRSAVARVLLRAVRGVGDSCHEAACTGSPAAHHATERCWPTAAVAADRAAAAQPPCPASRLALAAEHDGGPPGRGCGPAQLGQQWRAADHCHLHAQRRCVRGSPVLPSVELQRQQPNAGGCAGLSFGHPPGSQQWLKLQVACWCSHFHHRMVPPPPLKLPRLLMSILAVVVPQARARPPLQVGSGCCYFLRTQPASRCLQLPPPVLPLALIPAAADMLLQAWWRLCWPSWDTG